MDALPMTLIRRFLAMTLMLSTAPTIFAASERADAIDLRSQDCPATDDIPRGAICMRATVPEDYDKPAGRMIGLDIVILKAMRHEASSVPLFVLQGGPGDRTTRTAGDEAEMWAKFRRAHDLVFVDQRGNGETPELGCAAEMATSPSLATDLWPAAQLAACARRLTMSADLSRYTTTDAARDVHNVRAALGYAKIVSGQSTTLFTRAH